MESSRKLIRGAMVLSLGQLTSYGFSFARNIILARILAKTDFGLAALFSMTIMLLEMTGRMSFGQQIIQSKDGGTPVFQATSHTFQFGMSLASSLLILGCSYPMARAMHVQDIVWAFAALAIVPLARGFEHLDYYRLQRDLNYLPTVLCDVVPQLITTLVAWPLAVWLGDFRVIIWLMIGKAVLGILMTHLLAKQPFRWAWHLDFAKGMWTFGWPLLVNGLLIFASQQADQVLVGAFLSLENLASYALALSLVSIPGSIFAQVASSLMLPILARAQDDPELFRKRFRTCVEHAGVAAVVLLLPIIVAGEQLASILFGSKYSGMGNLAALLGAAAAVRFLRIVPAIASMARADTVNQLYSNVCRGLSLPLAAVAAMLGGGVVLIASCAVLAELLATLVSVLRLRQRQGVLLSDSAAAAAYVLSFISIGVALIFLGATHWSLWLAGICTSLALCLPILVAWIAFPEAIRMLLNVANRKRQVIV